MDEENLEDILGAAHHLQFTSIVNKCATYMKQSTTANNCLNHVRLVPDLSNSEKLRNNTKAGIILFPMGSLGEMGAFPYVCL